MVSLTIAICLGLVATTTQKSLAPTNVVELSELPELEALLLNLLKDEGNYQNPKTTELLIDKEMRSYLDKPKKKSSKRLKALNNKLSKHLDVLQERVMNENTDGPKCSCGYVNNLEPGIIKCHCDNSGRDGNDDGQDENMAKEYRQDGDSLDKYTEDEIFEKRLNEDKEDQDKQLARIGGYDDKDDAYWSDDNECGCNLLQNKGDNKGIINVRCGCNSPIRAGQDNDKDDIEYWTDDNTCGCELLRSKGDNNDILYSLRCGCNSPYRAGHSNNNDNDRGDDEWSGDNKCGCELLRNKRDSKNGIYNLRCGCNSPARVGRQYDDKDDDEYWSGDNKCGCELLGNKEDSQDGVYNLRCGCNSPTRAGREYYKLYDAFGNVYLVKENDEFQGLQLSDLSDDDYDTNQNTNHKHSVAYPNLNTLVNYVLKKEHDVDLNHLPKIKRKVLIKLRDILPNIKDVDTDELKNRVSSILDGDERDLSTLRERQTALYTDGNPSNVKEQLLNVIQQQKDNMRNYRRNMPKGIKVPFTFQAKGLAHVNN